MRKIILGAVAIAAAASFTPSSANCAATSSCGPTPGVNGCYVFGGEYGPTGHADCTYTSTGAAVSLLIATPNQVNLTWEKHKEVPDGLGGTICVSDGTGVSYADGSASLQQGPQSGATVPASDCFGPNVVTLSVGPDSAGFGVEGWIGSVTVFES